MQKMLRRSVRPMKKDVSQKIKKLIGKYKNAKALIRSCPFCKFECAQIYSRRISAGTMNYIRWELYYRLKKHWQSKHQFTQVPVKDDNHDEMCYIKINKP
jgi:hypothetical protein